MQHTLIFSISECTCAAPRSGCCLMKRDTVWYSAHSSFTARYGC